MAAADADDDGAITLVELELVPAPGRRPRPHDARARTFADLLRDTLLPRMFRLDDGPTCEDVTLA